MPFKIGCQNLGHRSFLSFLVGLNMDNQYHCKVIFDPSLSPTEIEARLQAIHLIKGVQRIETGRTDTVVPESPNRPAPPNVDNNSSRSLIEQALVWGVSESKITADQINQQDSEELVQTALSLLEQMPESLKRQLSQSLEP